MQTVATMAERLDMTAEEALERLQYMYYDVPGLDAEISDDICDVLIDVDDDPKVAQQVREQKDQERAKEEAAAAKKKATAEKKKAVAAKKKAAAAKKKAAAAKKKKASPKKKAVAKTDEASDTKADILPDVTAEIVEEDKVAPVAEILPPAAEVAPAMEAESKPEATIIIGSAIDHEEHATEVVRADGTHVDVGDVEVDLTRELPVTEGADDPDEELGLLAEAERRQEEEEDRKTKQVSRPSVKPDPAVVAEVIRKAELKRGAATTEKAGEGEVSRPKKPRPKLRGPAQSGMRKTGKTARKRQKKLEKMRADDAMKREAAAAVKEYQAGGFDSAPKKRGKKKRMTDDGAQEAVEEKLVIEVEDVMTVEELADAMEYETTDIILELMELNVMATKNQTLTLELVRQIAEPKGFEVESVIPEEQVILAEEPDDPATLVPRAPVVTVMGHVDHGKTSLLDRMRETSVASGEAGGITQHIAAYEVELEDGRVVFLDTPGHEAFTAMRARGAQVTDVVVLVVAADDGIMPQTIEAIDHAKAAEVPIVVAINKIDKPEAQPDRIRQELTAYDLLDEKWGGKTIMKEISAETGEGIKELAELLVLETQLLELKANPDKPARGAVVESEITKGQGPVAWVLIQSGTLKIGDPFLAGESFGRVRSMQNSKGVSLQEAGPSTPIVVTGFDSPPDAGDLFVAVKDERAARSVVEKRRNLSKLRLGKPVRHVTLEDFHEQLLAGEQRELKILLKTDVQGSVDVLASTIPTLGNEEVRAELVHAGVGSVNESDVLLASASDAVIVGFHVTTSPKVLRLADTEGVDIRTYQVIYEVTDDIRNALEGLLAPEQREVIMGHVEIRAIFKSSALGNIAGCYVLDGEVRRDSLSRITRDKEVIYEGRIDSLRREKNDSQSVQSGFECGIKLEKMDDIQVGDVIETYRLESVAKVLA